MELSLIETSKKLTEFLINGDGENALAMMNDAMREALGSSISGLWGQLVSLGGTFEGMGEIECSEQDGYRIVMIELRFANMPLIQRTVFDKEGRIAGLGINPGRLGAAVSAPPSGPISDTIEEFEVSFASDERFPLPGTLTLPREGKAFTAIVLVHGSGPQNRDERIGANHPFSDLAHSLAERGFAVLRYEKRTLMYGAQIAAGADYAKFTIDEETAEDAAAAVRYLQNDTRIASDKVYVLGHSLGGMLASYIGTKADCAGYIVMAGTPRKLWQIVTDQNLIVASDLAAAGNAEAISEITAFVEAESKKAASLTGLSDDQALNCTLFGMPAWYLRQLETIDTAALHMADGRPVLLLWGEKDRQVYETDWKLWKERLSGHPDVIFKSYPRLNHLFGDYTGDPVPLTRLVSEEYAAQTPIPEEVMDDIAAWLRAHA